MKNFDVAIIMGSDSDLSIMKDAAKFLEDMGISYEMKILSVHRTPEKAMEYANSLKENGVKVVIAGAGGAAHLPGVFAAMLPTVPVIGIPIHTKTSLQAGFICWKFISKPYFELLANAFIIKGSPLSLLTALEAFTSILIPSYQKSYSPE